MSKTSAAHIKKAPWIPPGKYKRNQTTASKLKNDALKPELGSKDPMTDIKKRILEQRRDLDLTYRVEQDADTKLGASSVSADQLNFQENVLELLSLSSDSSLNDISKLNTQLQFIQQEMAIMNAHFSALKTSLKFLYKFPSSLNVEESYARELWNKTEEHMKDFEASYEYLECSLILWQNVVDENEKNIEYVNVIKCKEVLLAKLLEAYANAVILFQSELKKQNRLPARQSEDLMRTKLQESERKCASQDAVIRDLERRVSIYQGKTNAMESYKSSLEETRDELQKHLSQKEMQIKSLNSQLLHFKNQGKGDHESLIEIIEELKTRGHAEKTALKKALKLQRLHVDKKEEKLQSTLLEIKEKEKMLFEIATQRDQLKVELTVASNAIIQLRNQIEDIKSQSSKHLEKIGEMEATSNLELQSLNKTLQEKMAIINSITDEKNSFEKKCEELNEKLQKVGKELRNLEEKNEDVERKMLSRVQNYENLNEAFQEVKHLVLLLQETKQLFQDFKSSSHVPSAGGDHMSYDVEPDNSRNNILHVVQESKELLLELKQTYTVFIDEKKQFPKQSETETQLIELQKKYNNCIKENELLKTELQTIKNSKSFNQIKERSGHTSPVNVRFSRNKMDADLEKDIQRIRYDYEMKLKDLEYELRETKNKLHMQESQNMKLASVEEELKSKKHALSLLEQRKEEEHDRFQSKIKELQESLDSITADYASLQFYTQQIKSSCFNVFGFS